MRSLKKEKYTEKDLVDSFFYNSLPYRLFKKNTIALEEPNLPVGFPDIVLCTLQDNFQEIISREYILDYHQLKLLHYIYLSKGVSLDTIEKKLLFSSSFVNNNIDSFLSKGLVKLDENTVRLNPLDEIFVIDRIVAIEAKLTNWKKVIDQANRNRWFASESYILMPPKMNFKKVMKESRKRGIGILTPRLDSNHILLKSDKSNIPKSYGSWIVNEMLIKKLQENV